MRRDVYKHKLVEDTYLCDVNILPIMANLGLKTACLLERYARPFRTSPNMLCKIRPVALELIPVRTQ